MDRVVASQFDGYLKANHFWEIDARVATAESRHRQGLSSELEVLMNSLGLSGIIEIWTTESPGYGDIRRPNWKFD